MRKIGTLAGLTLFALAATARAKETTPAADTAAPPAPPAAAADATPAPAADTAAPPASDAVAASAPAATQPATSRRKFQVGLSFLPMEMGKYTFSDSFSSTLTTEAYFAYGFSLSVGYEVLPGLFVGLAPQAIFNVQAKPSDTFYEAAMRQYDIMARVAYVFPVMDTISVYAEVLPGYSLIVPSDNAAVSKGLVVAFGVGCAMDMTDRFFINIGAGYQIGFQSQDEGIHQMELRTRYVRLAMGGGVKF